MKNEETKTTKIYHSIKESSKSWKWKGKFLFYVVFISLFTFSAFYTPEMRISENSLISSAGLLINLSMFIQFIVFCDLKTTMSFYSVKNASHFKEPKGLQYFDNCKYWIKTKVLTDNESTNHGIFLFYSFITLLIMLAGMNKVFELMDHPSIWKVLHILI